MKNSEPGHRFSRPQREVFRRRLRGADLNPADGRGREPRDRRRELPRSSSAKVSTPVDRTAAYAWRFLAIGLAGYAGLWLVGKLLVVVVPVFLAVLVARGVSPISFWLQSHRWKPSLAALATLGGFLLLFVGVIGLAGARLTSEFDQLGSTISEGIDDVKVRLLDSKTLDLNQADLDRFSDRISNSVSEFFSSDQGALLSGAASVGKAILGIFLTLIVTFFLLKDGATFWKTVTGWFPSGRQDLVQRCGQRAWDALGGYLRGAALLGVVEATVVGITLAVLGAKLIMPVMLVTLIAAFVPIVGAVAAGLVAVLVALATVGTSGALIMAVVAIVLQQLDNDLLAPVIYGRALRIHALTILLGITAGGALFGFLGSVFAVPVIAVVLNVSHELRSSAAPAEVGTST